MALDRQFRFAPRVFPMDWRGGIPWRDAGELLARLRGRRAPILLDSAGGRPARFHLLGLDPLEPAVAPRSLADLRALLDRVATLDGDEVPGPFAGGFLGALSYDLGVEGEDLGLPVEPWGFPPVVGGIYTDFLYVDLEGEEAWLVLGDEPGDGRASVETRRTELGALLAGPPPERGELRLVRGFERCVSAEDHQARVEQVRELIAAGEVYQVNLAHRLLARVEASEIEVYRRLRESNRAPYMGYASFAEGALLSASPELLLEFDGRLARTRPIKGTAPRGRTPDEDAALAAALLASPKDLAELGMIVDLERNDLGRVAKVGTVRVPEFPKLESYPGVHHLVADVLAEPRDGVDGLALLASLFPGGSITGAPKLRSMEVIAELEGEGRGYFTGALGFVDLRGRALWNILIRTLQWRPAGSEGLGEISLRVGGGITWASDAAAEDEETLAKAASLRSALGDPDFPPR